MFTVFCIEKIVLFQESTTKYVGNILENNIFKYEYSSIGSVARNPCIFFPYTVESCDILFQQQIPG